MADQIYDDYEVDTLPDLYRPEGTSTLIRLDLAPPRESTSPGSRAQLSLLPPPSARMDGLG